MNGPNPITPTGTSGQTSDESALQQSIMNFALALAQSIRSDLTDDLSKLQQKWQEDKRESGET